MRVIVLSDYGFVNGGAAQVAISSVCGLAKTDLDVTFVSSVGPVADVIDRELVRVFNFGYHDLLDNPSRIEASILGIWNSGCADRFREVLERYDRKDTIVHLHSWVKSLSSSVVKVAIDRGFRVVCTLHDYFSVCPNGGFYSYTQQKQCPLSPMSFACVIDNCDSRNYAQKLWRVGRQLVQKRFGGIPEGIKYFITVSNYSEELLRPWLPSTAEFFRVANPIDIEKDEPSTVAGNSVFTFIGRLAPEKGPDVFAAAASLCGVQAVFVGSGPMEKAVTALNRPARILGWCDRERVIQAVRASRAIVFPSRWHETQGLVVQEAAALGVPAIVSDSCAAREAVVDGKTGLLFRSGDSHELSRMLSLLDHDPELAARQGISAYDDYWKAPSTIEVHSKRLIECYGNIMSRTD